jgi:hypothetical protein
MGVGLNQSQGSHLGEARGEEHQLKHLRCGFEEFIHVWALGHVDVVALALDFNRNHKVRVRHRLRGEMGWRGSAATHGEQMVKDT